MQDEHDDPRSRPWPACSIPTIPRRCARPCAPVSRRRRLPRTGRRAQGADRAACRLRLLGAGRGARLRDARAAARRDRARGAARSRPTASPSAGSRSRARRPSTRRSATSRSTAPAPRALGRSRRCASSTPRTPRSTASRCSCRSCRRRSAPSCWCRSSVGDATPQEVAEVLERALGRTRDADRRELRPPPLPRLRRRRARSTRATTRAIEALRPEALDEQSACGRVPVRGLLVGARGTGSQRARSTCATPATPPARAIASSATGPMPSPESRAAGTLGPTSSATLLDVARASIEHGSAPAGRSTSTSRRSRPRCASCARAS